MRVGVLPYSSATMDGAFHYEIVFLDALNEIAARSREEFIFLAAQGSTLGPLAKTGGVAFRGLPVRPLGRAASEQQPPEAYLALPPEQPKIDPNGLYCERDNAAAFRSAKIDLVLQLSQQGLHGHAFASLVPFVTPIYDLNHRLQPEFPEVSANGEFNSREYIYGNICRFATFVLVDSEAGKEDVLRFYGNLIAPERIRILRYYPPIRKKPTPQLADLARVAAKYRLPERYFFYPAQFWRHKNHAAILRALRIVATQTGVRIPVVFCGGYSDYQRATNFIEIKRLAAQLGVEQSVRYLGAVPDEDMGPLYVLSTALIMPSFFGPTNIPPLEAWHFGRPVIASDIRGVREQIADAGLLVDPRSPDALAPAMLALWRDPQFCAQMAERGRRRLESYSWETFVEAVERIVTDACERVRNGRAPRYPEGALKLLHAP